MEISYWLLIELYHISIVYVANTLTAFILMNVMASKIHLSNVTKFKIGIGGTTFVFIGLSVVTEWWMAAIYGISWSNLGIFVHRWKLSLDGE